MRALWPTACGTRAGSVGYDRDCRVRAFVRVSPDPNAVDRLVHVEEEVHGSSEEGGPLQNGSLPGIGPSGGEIATLR